MEIADAYAFVFIDCTHFGGDKLRTSTRAVGCKIGKFLHALLS
jgi:hypothetical protein